jgi:hypothetical protein
MPNAVNPVNEGYLADVRTSPLAYYSYMVGIAENYELLSGGNAKTRMFERLCLSYRVNMVKLISREIQEIQEMNRPPSDVLLAALIALTASASTSRDRAKFGPLELAKSSRFKSPLRTAQFIHVYSANQYPSVHTEALIRLIIMKGGLSKIGSPGVASVASLSVKPASIYIHLVRGLQSANAAKVRAGYLFPDERPAHYSFNVSTHPGGFPRLVSGGY